ncbi:MAG: DMT family transporter [Cytophagales bacterium]
MEKLKKIIQNLPWIGFIYVLIGAFLFSSKGVVIKLAYNEGVDALSVLTFRMIFAAPFYLFFAFKPIPKANNVTQNDISLLILLGIVGYYFSSLFDFYGLETISAGLERLILFIYPTFVALLAFFILKKEIKWFTWISLLLTYLGVLLVVLHDVNTYKKAAYVGMGFVALSALTYAIYMVFSEKLIHKFGTIIFTSWVMLVSTVCVVIHYLFTNSLRNLFNYSTKFYILALILAFFGTVIPSFLATAGMKLIGAKNSAITATIGPVWTIILANLVLNEPVQAIQIAGTFLVVIGVLLSAINKS